MKLIKSIFFVSAFAVLTGATKADGVSFAGTMCLLPLSVLRRFVCLIRTQSGLAVALALFACAMTVTAQKDSPSGGTNDVTQTGGAVTNDVGQVDGGVTNDVGQIGGRLLSLQRPVTIGAPAPSASTFISSTQSSSSLFWRQENVVTNVAVSYARPAGSERNEYWWKRGGIETAFRLYLDGFTFPLGTNDVTSLIATAFGAVRAFARRPETEILASTSRLAADPFQSEFWYGHGTNANYFLTWRNFRFVEPPHDWVNAQLELRSSGDFIVRSNEVEYVYRRIEPFDWDGDGLPNDIDPNPHECDGDYFGPANELPEGANTNCYYWVDVVSENRTALVRFAGDGDSNYPDPYFIARAGETNRVLLLIGKTYSVTSSVPVRCVGVSDAAVAGGMGQWTPFEVVWPVEFRPRPTLGAELPRSGYSRITIGQGVWFGVFPDYLGGSFDLGSSCCNIISVNAGYSFLCSDACTCSGCSSDVYYRYEGYRLYAFVYECGCSYRQVPGDIGGASVGFTSDAVFFEDAYENSPGVLVGRTNTISTLLFSASGGPNGGVVSMRVVSGSDCVVISNATEALPNGLVLAPNQIFTGSASVYPVSPCASFTVESVFSDAANGMVKTNRASLAVIRVELAAVFDAPEYHNPHRHTFGVGEKVRFLHQPEELPVDYLAIKGDVTDVSRRYETFGGNISESDRYRIYVCPVSSSYVARASIAYRNARYFPKLSIVEPQDVVSTNAVAVRNDDWVPAGACGTAYLVTYGRIHPMSVSFRGIMVAEIPCTNAIPPTGYFATSNFVGLTTHDGRAGAGIGHAIKDGNYWAEDQAGRKVPYENWSAGRMEWKIPFGWFRLGPEVDGMPMHDIRTDIEFPEREEYANASSRPLIIGGREDRFIQSFEIDEAGTATVEKLGHRLSRTLSGALTLDGREL